MRFFFPLFLIVFLLAGCAAPASRWREDALNRFNSVVSAGSLQFAPEETEAIRQTLALADRYFTRQQHDDAGRLYQLSCQKSQLLYRNLVLSNVQQGSVTAIQNETAKASEKIAIAANSVSNCEVIKPVEQESASPTPGVSSITCSETPDVESLLDKPASAALTPAEFRYSGLLPTYEPAEIIRENNPVSTNIFPVAHLDTEQHKKPSENETVPATLTATPALTPAKKISRGNTVAKLSDPGRTTIYLTFDDGPSRLTLPIAAYLNSEGIAATFFALGSNVKGHEEVVRDTVALGHRVGNHTLSHDLRKLNGSLYQGVNEIEKTAAMIEKLGGDGKMVRIPYGASSKALTSTVSSEGGEIFNWDINSLDSSKRGAKNHAFIEQAVIHQLQKSGKRHIIMLFHDGAGHEETLVAIRNLVPHLKLAGYRFGLLSRNERVVQSRLEGNPTP